MMSLADVARRALPLVDLTDLTDTCTPEAIDALCTKARTPHGSVAAVCIYPPFVAQAKRLLVGSAVKVATVVNFPDGNNGNDEVARETEAALADGADEIDLVMDYNRFLEGGCERVETQIRRVRQLTRHATLKVILETGRLQLPETIRAASDLVIVCEADFLKTSTGKVEVNATPEAARIMLAAIKASGRPVGFKAAGGVRSAAEAAIYLTLADDILGPDWVAPATFRFGASGLLGDLIAQLDGTAITDLNPVS